MIETNLDALFDGSSQTWAASLVTEIQVRTVFLPFSPPAPISLSLSLPSPLSPHSQSGAFKADAAGWLACSSTTQPLSRRRGLREEILETIAERSSTKTTPITPLACPLVWAQESNAFDCVRRFASSLYLFVG